MKKLLTIAICCVMLLGNFPSLHGQNDGDVRLDVILTPSLTRAQVLGLTSLGIDDRGQGNKLMDLIIQNTTQEPITDLYFRIFIDAAGFGAITDLRQRAPGFTLAAGQNIIASNNQLKDGIPGISTSINIETGDTDRTEDFINSLEGSTTLPDDVYTVTMQIRKGSSDGEIVAEVIRSLGAEPKQTSVDLFLQMPGDDIGTGEKITSANPMFRWDGPSGLNYRLIVVEAVGQQSPEALIQGALATGAAYNSASYTGTGVAGGSLLEYEMVDANVGGTSFNWPPNGVQKLSPGSKYYWQVYTKVGSASGDIEIPSTIWEFTLTDLQNATSAEQTNEVFVQLQSLVGADFVSSLQQGGFKLSKIEIGGKTITGQQAIALEIEKIMQAIQAGEIKTGGQ